jgi:hypothetical protein
MINNFGITTPPDWISNEREQGSEDLRLTNIRPAIASDGAGFLLGWLDTESEQGSQRVLRVRALALIGIVWSGW